MKKITKFPLPDKKFSAVSFICRKYVGMAMVWYGILFIHIERISTRPMFKRERAKYLQIHTY